MTWPGTTKSNGYEEIAAEFAAGRGRVVGGIGASTVVEWSDDE
jgi:hypothetical protein